MRNDITTELRRELDRRRWRAAAGRPAAVAAAASVVLLLSSFVFNWLGAWLALALLWVSVFLAALLPFLFRPKTL